MKNKLIILMAALSFQACGQKLKTENKGPEVSSVDFWKHNGDGRLACDTSGIISFRSYYEGKKNEIGYATVYLIHKNGGRWWCKQAKKRFPNYFIAEEKCANLLLKEDSVTLKDYNKWAFFVDKKYLVKVGEESAEGNNGIATFDVYGTKPNTAVSILLYEQKAGSKKWILIDKFEYTSDNEGGRPKTKDSNGDWHYPINDWEFGFIRKKMEESNAGK